MKEELRAEARRRLRRMAPAARLRASAAIAARVWQLPEIAGARRVLLFASLPQEVATGAIAEEAARRGIELVYPRCLPARELALHRVAKPGALSAGRYGIREPDADWPRVAPADIDVALVPGLGWDREGRRLGRGAGYYDRLLGSADWRTFACGLFFAAQEFPVLPVDPWDVHLDAIVTEHELVRPAPSRKAG